MSNKDNHLRFNKFTQEIREEIVRKRQAGASYVDLKEEYDVSQWSVRRWVDAYGHTVERGLSVPSGHLLKKSTRQVTWRDEEGNYQAEWLTHIKDSEEIQEAFEAMVRGMSEELPTVKPIKPPNNWNEQLAVVIPIGDAHIGMYAWDEECGDSFDLAIATRDICAAFDYLIAQGPNCERAIIANVGDFLHYSTMEAKTEKHGNILEPSGRAQAMVKAGVSALRYCIERAAEKHQYVDVINACGNHDSLLAHTLNIMMDNIYQDNDRIIVHSQPTSRHYVQHGKVLIGVVHGHQTKDKDLPIIMANECPVQWGETEHRVWFRGHHHHDSRVEYNGAVVVEQVRTLAAKDAYAVEGGYIAGRDLKQIIYHKEYGEMGRNICGIGMLKSMLNND